MGGTAILSLSQSREMGARYLNVTANFIRPNGYCGCCVCRSMNIRDIRPCWLNIITPAAPIVRIAGTGWLKTWNTQGWNTCNYRIEYGGLSTQPIVTLTAFCSVQAANVGCLPHANLGSICCAAPPWLESSFVIEEVFSSSNF